MDLEGSSGRFISIQAFKDMLENTRGLSSPPRHPAKSQATPPEVKLFQHIEHIGNSARKHHHLISRRKCPATLNFPVLTNLVSRSPNETVDFLVRRWAMRFWQSSACRRRTSSLPALHNFRFMRRRAVSSLAFSFGPDLCSNKAGITTADRDPILSNEEDSPR